MNQGLLYARSLDRESLTTIEIARFWSHVEMTEECWPWQKSRSAGGYGRFGFNHQVHFAHRVAYVLTHGFLPAGPLVLHHCDNPPCVRPEHLYMGTPADNMRDRGERSGFPELGIYRGTGNQRSKLTEEQVREIRARCAAGENRTQLGRAFGISRQNASDIVARKIWAWLD